MIGAVVAGEGAAGEGVDCVDDRNLGGGGAEKENYLLSPSDLRRSMAVAHRQGPRARGAFRVQ